MRIHIPHHHKIPYRGENKKQRKDKTKRENQTVVAYQVTRVQHSGVVPIK